MILAGCPPSKNPTVPKVVLVPGFTQTASSWEGVREVLDESCDVVALDVPIRDTFEATAGAIAGRGRRSQPRMSGSREGRSGKDWRETSGGRPRALPLSHPRKPC